jgi:SAM-dependent methyltransferase
MQESMWSDLRRPRTLCWQMYNSLYGRLNRDSTSLYCIAPGYGHRSCECFFDDTSNTDAWQKEVYQYAAHIMELEGLSTVYDVGCGSAYKLINYLGKFKTVGFDLPKTVKFLNRKYPDRSWFEIDFCGQNMPEADLVICADVIEHVLDPDQLLARIAAVAGKYIILSTPDRNLLYPLSSPFYHGPPRKTCHIREWAFVEFERYISRTFNILDHRISNRRQATQMMLLTPGRRAALRRQPARGSCSDRA